MVPADADEVTVTGSVANAIPHAPDTSYEIVALPALIPETTPDELTVATSVLLLVHVPPETVAERVELVAGQIVDVPLIVPAFVAAFTVTTRVTDDDPQLVVTV
jgi:hypothetical protein